VYSYVQKNSDSLLSLLRVLSGLDKNFPLPYAVFLLEVARNEGCSLGDIRKATGIPLPTCSRILWALATKRQTGAEPYSLIEQDYLAEDRHRPSGFSQTTSVCFPGDRDHQSKRCMSPGGTNQFSLELIWPARRKR
jgi:hypothetical protein